MKAPRSGPSLARRSVGSSLFLAAAIGAGLLLTTLFPGEDAGVLEPGGAEVFRLREVSAFERGADAFLRGQSGQCADTPSADVNAYPAFVSSKPIYGSVRFGARGDEVPETGPAHHFAVDESQGTGKGFDRLYFDLNRDGDLRNDGVVLPHRRAPSGAVVASLGLKEQVVFNFLRVGFEFGLGTRRPVELMPRLVITEYRGQPYTQMSFVRTRLYAGAIKVGGKPYQARLGNDYLITGGLDAPHAALVLSEGDADQPWYSWWGGDRLMAAHKIGGRFYTFTATPNGDQLTVRPYTGELGTFRIGPGTRQLEGLAMSGSLEARDRTAAVGELTTDQVSMAATATCELPVGDYLPTYLRIEFGRLRITVSQNYHSDGHPRERAGRAAVHGIPIRADKPFVLDFSNQPEVMFAAPATNQTLKRGDTLLVKAVLVDAPLDLMIRGLDDATRKQTKDADGNALGYQRDLSLDPTVTVTRASGEKVAEGVMPFG